MVLYDKMGISTAKMFSGINEMHLLKCHDCDLMFFSPMISAGSDLYQALQRNRDYYPADKAEYSFARRFIKPSDDVLEIGCGTGAFARLISPRSYRGIEKNVSLVGKSLEGIEISDETLQHHACRCKGKNDVVCMFQVLEHVPDVRDFLEDAMTCLKPGGILIISVPSADSFLRFMPNNALNLPPHHVTWWTDRCLQNVAGYLGASIAKMGHQKLEKEHAKYYLPALWRGLMMPRNKNGMELIDTAFNERATPTILAKLSVSIQTILENQLLGVRGHSVTVVYKKGAE
jgi:SAM-dependent methyltransferase